LSSEKVDCRRKSRGERRGGLRIALRLTACLVLTVNFIVAPGGRSEEVTVEAEAVPEAVKVHPTGSVTSIDTRDASEKVSDLGETLEQSAGVTVKRYGGLGSFSVVMLRGASPNQVKVFLDGVPLSGAAAGAVNLADLPLDSLERIDVYRGVAPLGFGGAPIGGVVNLVTRRTQKGWSAGGSASYGSFDTYKGDAFASVADEKFNAFAFYTHMQSRGDFEYPDDNATPYNEEDDEWVKRRNNDFYSHDFLAKGGWNATDSLEIFAANDFFQKDAGLPGIGAFRVEEARFAKLRNTSYLGMQYEVSKLNLRGLSYYTYMNEKYEDPLGEIGVGSQQNRYYTRIYGGNLLARYFFGRFAALAAFAEGKTEKYTERDLLNDRTGPEYVRDSFAGALQGEIYLAGDSLTLVPTIRAEHYANDYPASPLSIYGGPYPDRENTETVYSPHFGMRFQPWRSVTFTANAGKYYRIPSFVELFGDRGSIVGNPELEPESGVHADAGAGLMLKNKGPLDSLRLAYAFYYMEIEDIIVMIQNSQRTARPQNISKAEIFGHEIGMDLTAFDAVKMHVVYTHQSALDKSDASHLRDNPLPGRPRNELHLRGGLFRRKLGEVFYTFDYMDGNYLDRAGILEVPARRIHGAGITVRPLEGLSLTLEAKNLGDEQISDVLGYPLPGRSYYGTVRYVYHGASKAPE